MESLSWVEAVLGRDLGAASLKDQMDFQAVLRNGAVLCELINAIRPGSVKKINTMNAPFKQVTTAVCKYISSSETV